MPSLNLTPTLSFELKFRMFILFKGEITGFFFRKGYSKGTGIVMFPLIQVPDTLSEYFPINLKGISCLLGFYSSLPLRYYTLQFFFKFTKRSGL